MEIENYKKYFNQFFKGAINIDGIKLTLTNVEEPDGDNGLINEMIHLSMSNPNDLSYNRLALEAIAHEKLERFNRVFALGSYGLGDIDISNTYGVYIGSGDNVGELIENVLKNKTLLRSATYGSSTYRTKVFDVFKVKHIDFNCRKEGDFIEITNFVKPIEAYVLKENGEKRIEELPIDDELEYLYQEGFNGRYEETEMNYLDMDDVDFPTRFLDNDFQSTYVYTRFVI